jgi:hypothetical protein
LALSSLTLGRFLDLDPISNPWISTQHCSRQDPASRGREFGPNLWRWDIPPCEEKFLREKRERIFIHMKKQEYPRGVSSVSLSTVAVNARA